MKIRELYEKLDGFAKVEIVELLRIQHICEAPDIKPKILFYGDAGDIPIWLSEFEVDEISFSVWETVQGSGKNIKRGVDGKIRIRVLNE